MRKLCLLTICLTILTGCASVPETALFAEPIVYSTDTVSLPSNFDLSYSMHYQVMNKAAKDCVSIRVKTMLYDYRFDFLVSKDITKIFNHFLQISEMAEKQQRKNGFEHLAASTLHAYAYSENTVARVVVDGIKPNWLGFSFLLRDGERYLVIDGFKAESLSSALPINSKIESILLKYDDVKKMTEFLHDTDTIEELRKKHRVIKQNEGEQKSVVVESEDMVVTTDEELRTENAPLEPADSIDQSEAVELPAGSAHSE